MQARYQFTSVISASLGVNNLLDRDPCMLTQSSQYGAIGINTDPSMYDITGREYYLALRITM